MQVSYQVNDHTTVVATGETPVEVFENLAKLQEVFSETCRKCKSDFGVRFVRRIASGGKKEYVYHEMLCLNPKCKAKLVLGHSDDGVIYPKRYKMEGKEYVLDENGKRQILGDYGWTVYQKGEES